MATKTNDRSLSEKRSVREDERRRSNREAILRAAEAVICRRGFDATSMDDVAAEAGFSKATLYKYVRGKSELVFELLVHFLEMLDERIREIIARPLSPEARLKILIRETFRLQVEQGPLAKAFLSDHGLFRLMHAVVEAKDGAGSGAERAFLHRILSVQRALYGRVEAFLKDGIASGAFRPMPVDSAVRFLGILAQGYKHDRFLQERKPNLEKDVSDIYTFILQGISSGNKASV